VAGNRIGTGALGTAALANGADGVIIHGGAAANTIGGDVTSAGNVIAGNVTNGVEVTGAGSTGNTVAGNQIGTNASGMAALANGADGVLLSGGAAGNTVGGNAAPAGNVISGNTTNGVDITGAGSSGNTVVGNQIGTNASGTAALANGGDGVFLSGGAAGNTVGGTAAGAANVISGNTTNGVAIDGGGSNLNAVSGNLIGTDAAGTAALANGVDGIQITGGATGNTIGGFVAAARNLLSGNTNAGVDVSGAGTSGEIIAGNWIGTDATGRSPIANQLGVLIEGGTGTTIGGPMMGAGNVISGNFTAGIELDGNAVSGTSILGNLIGTDSTGTAAVVRPGQSGQLQSLQNAGVVVIGSQGNTIGGASASARNILSGNYVGLMLATTLSPISPNVMVGNFIGTNLAGDKAVGNVVGVYVNGAAGNQIGASGPGLGNIISGNSSVGVEIFGAGSAGNSIQGNTIGLAADGRGVFRDSRGLFTQGYGIFILDASGNAIGGSTAGAGNVISGNESAGILIQRQTGKASGNVIDGNFIGSVPGGATGPGNDGYGIALVNAQNNPIGRTGSAANHFGRNGISNIRVFFGAVPAEPAATEARRTRIRKVPRPAGPARAGRYSVGIFNHENTKVRKHERRPH
jgi:titin